MKALINSLITGFSSFTIYAEIPKTEITPDISQYFFAVGDYFANSMKKYDSKK